MKLKGMLLILLSILGVAGLLTYKYIKKTFIFIGPKSTAVFIICGILIIIGSRLLLRSKK